MTMKNYCGMSCLALTLMLFACGGKLESVADAREEPVVVPADAAPAPPEEPADVGRLVLSCSFTEFVRRDPFAMCGETNPPPDTTCPSCEQDPSGMCVTRPVSYQVHLFKDGHREGVFRVDGTHSASVLFFSDVYTNWIESRTTVERLALHESWEGSLRLVQGKTFLQVVLLSEGEQFTNVSACETR